MFYKKILTLLSQKINKTKKDLFLFCRPLFSCRPEAERPKGLLDPSGLAPLRTTPYPVALSHFSCHPERQRRASFRGPSGLTALRKTKRGHPEAERPKGLLDPSGLAPLRTTPYPVALSEAKGLPQGLSRFTPFRMLG